MLKPISFEHVEPDVTGTPVDSLMLGLDILEYMAAEAAPKAISDIARQMKVERFQAFRTVKALARLGYIASGRVRGTYVATSRLYELGVNAPFIQRLLDRARPVMQALSDEVQQSCNLAVPFGRHLTVVMQTEAAGNFSINVPIGYRYEGPASAPALACFALARSPVQAESLIGGVMDLSCPIFDGTNVAAVITIPYIRTVESLPLDQCLEALQDAATLLSRGAQSAPQLTLLYG